ncbi:BACON domain-containing protein [Streptomyces sp. BP-8]|uniref:Sigma-70 family RNA polymerase sigma factor n=1 Tax=Streptomyces sirii TaxID=3127701 RepID=A0ABZ2QQC7_9ACTN
MSSRPEHPTHSTGAHRSRGDGRRRPHPAERPVPLGPGERDDGYEPYLDGLFTYCLSVLCDHDAAAAVLGEMLALAEHRRGRRPDDPAMHRSWLYALARWACLRRLAERTGSARKAGGAVLGKPGAGPVAASNGTGTSDGAPAGSSGTAAARDAERRQRELAALAWPEAAGTTPEQREALELSVRHRLSADEVAAVLGADPIATRALLATASCEVERTRAALAVVESGRCREVARLAGDSQMLLGAALSRELVRHVDDCAECRRTAERATVPGAWPGTAPVARGTLPLVGAPGEAVLAALAAARRSRSGHAEGVPGAGRGDRSRGANGFPRYDRDGFPVGAPTDRAARRRRLRARALTTTVVATVVAAPVLALWAAYRSAPATGEAADDSPVVTASDTDSSAQMGGRPYENAGNARTTPEPGSRAGAGPSDVSVEVVGGETRAAERAGRAARGPGRLEVAAQPSGGTTVITLSASGGAPVRWTASSGAPWLLMSHTAGSLRPGQSTTITVYVDHDREPAGRWRARIAIGPGRTAVTMEGFGAPEPGPGPQDPTPTNPRPTPSGPAPTPTPTPTAPSPTPTPTASTPAPTPTTSEPTSRPSNTARPAG